MDTKVNFLVQYLSDDENYPRLMQAIKNQGHVAVGCDYIPFESGEYNQFGPAECVTFFGSLGFARQLQRTKPWVPGPFCNFSNFKCSTYRAYWSKYLWNNRVIFLPYAEFKYRIIDVLNYFGIDYYNYNNPWSLFIRPDDGFKTFTGQVIDSKSYSSDFRYLDSRCKPDTLICVSPTKTPLMEWRVFCKDREIICGSQYRIKGRLETTEVEGLPEAVTNYLQQVLDEVAWLPERLYVVDIGVREVFRLPKLTEKLNFDSIGTPSAEYGVIELNSWSCSGMYKCNVDKIVAAAATVAMQEYQDVNQV